MTDDPSEARSVENRVLAYPPLRYAVLAFGWLMFAIGIISVPVPLFPSSVFLLAAVWAFSLSSPRFRAWILKRRWLNAALRARNLQRAFLRYGMILAIGTMIVSLAVVVLIVAESWLAPIAVAAILVPLARYILSRPRTEAD